MPDLEPTMRPCGDLLLELVARDSAESVLVAPFIKHDVLGRLLSRLSPRASLQVFTRWRPDEVAAGVSDLEVFEVLATRPRSALFLCTPLHAKYYRADEQVLVGSANLTQAALGWSPRSNLELLLSASWPAPQFLKFEELLLSLSVPATVDIRDRVAAAASLLDRFPQPSAAEPTAEAPELFIPQTRNPEMLFLAYSGRVDALTTAARQQSADDLLALGLPSGLDDAQFRRFVGAILLQEPLVAEIDEFVARPRRFGEVRNLMAARLHSARRQRDPAEAWQTLIRWLLHFVPGRHRVMVQRYTEVFVRIRE